MTFSTIYEIRRLAKRQCVEMPALAIGWLLNQPGITSVLFGARNALQAQGNVSAAETALSRETLAELTGLTEALKRELGANPDPWRDRMK